jgi:hypothetical protein
MKKNTVPKENNLKYNTIIIGAVSILSSLGLSLLQLRTP